ncbi:MAG: 23S rRNA (pseudouridine(1915)-N(3))-methyltransferase RlmH [Gemmatimonadetes bacterium]|nr:23S rRNA (pseudouridine(1915)-N(3))-methyltransferase RlmH [Gemmatimonadota bacterium]
MRVILLSVGKLRGLFADPVGEFETRVARYFAFEAVEVKEEPATRSRSAEQVMNEEGRRLLARLPPGYDLVALHRKGRFWSSDQLATYLQGLADRAAPGVAFAIGGAFGLSDEVLGRATHLLSLSAMTLPHEMARLVCTEQIYRAGTILRGEPYHKATDGRSTQGKN